MSETLNLRANTSWFHYGGAPMQRQRSEVTYPRRIVHVACDAPVIALRGRQPTTLRKTYLDRAQQTLLSWIRLKS